MSVFLREKKLTSNKKSHYLDIYINGKRHYEFLNMYLTKNREQNKEIRSLAESIRAKREIEIKNLRPERIRELKSSIRWTLEKMYDRIKQGT